MIERCSVSGEGEGEMREVVGVDLRFVCSSTHHPLPIITDSYTRAGFFEFEILEKLDAIGVLGIIFQAALSFAGDPVRKGPGCGGARYRIDWHLVRIRELHDENLCCSWGKKSVVKLQKIFEAVGKFFVILSAATGIPYSLARNVSAATEAMGYDLTDSRASLGGGRHLMA